MKSTWGLFGVIVSLVMGLLAFGTTGYRAIETGWSFGEAFFTTVITISTVGFSEIHPLSPQGRLFTVLLIFLGLFVISVIGTYGARLLIDHEIKDILGRKKMKRDIAQLTDHYVVCGFGRIGSVICDELSRAGQPFVIIEMDDTLVQQAEGLGYRIIKGDATLDPVLKQAGVDRAHGVVAALNSDAHNLFISLAAREINSDVEIIARGEETGIESRLLRAGANMVVSPLKLGGSQIARLILGDFKSKSDAQEPVSQMGQLMMQQVQNTRDIQVSTEDMLKQAHGLLAVAIQRADGRKEIMPSPQAQLEPHDTLFVCGVENTP
jgi:voltage-gated potassium channel